MSPVPLRRKLNFNKIKPICSPCICVLSNLLASKRTKPDRGPGPRSSTKADFLYSFRLLNVPRFFLGCHRAVLHGWCESNVKVNILWGFVTGLI